MDLTVDELLRDESYIALGRRILAGKCSVFVGAGASVDSGGPSSTELADLLARDVLMSDERGMSLPDVVDYADGTTGRARVNEVIAARLSDLQPSPALVSLAGLPWRSAYSVNFDDLLEKAYSVAQPGRALVHFSAEDLERLAPDRIPIYMLHGSIKMPNDRHMGLVLTQDDLLKAANQRTAFYRRLSDDMQAGEVVYVGFSLLDSDFRRVVSELHDSIGNQPSLIPRGYAVLHNPPSFAQNHWDTKKITLLPTTLAVFASAVETLRGGQVVQPIAIGSAPLLPQFLRDISPASAAAAELASVFDFPELDDGEPEARLFLRGGPATWATIRERYDASRDLCDDIQTALLVGPSDEPTRDSHSATKWFLLCGSAGSGKSTLARRVAWELSHTWAKPVAWVRHPSRLQLDVIETLVAQAKERVYVFVDDAGDSGGQVTNAIERCRHRGLRVSFFVAERENEWISATEQHPLEPNRQFQLDPLSNGEALGIIDRLGRAHELGTLDGLSAEEQISRLVNRAQRQLLVAMREVTEDLHFDEIMVNEYENLPTDSARRAYLVICSLFQFGVATRAGVLSRTTGVPFDRFRDAILLPAKDVIVEIQDHPWQQPTYVARHRLIADVVFRRAFQTSAQRSVQIQALLQNLDPGYREDVRAYARLTNARWLKERRLENEDQDRIFDLARRLRPTDGHVVQQHALAWRFRDRTEADRILNEASELAPSSDAIRHSKAILMLDDAREAQGFRRSDLVGKAEQAFRQLIHSEPSNSASYVSLTDTLLLRAEDEGEPAARIALLASARRVVQDGFRHATVTSYLLDAAGRVDEASGHLAEAEDDYKKAAQAAGPDPHVWVTYARFLDEHRGPKPAAAALQEALDDNPIDPLLNHELARLLERIEPANEGAIRSAYRLAIAEPVMGHLAELDLAIYLHERGHVEEAEGHFRTLRGSDLPGHVKARARRWRMLNGERVNMKAEIADIRFDRAYVRVQGQPSTIFMRVTDLPPKQRAIGAVVDCRLFYNCYGLTAVPAATRAERSGGK